MEFVTLFIFIAVVAQVSTKPQLRKGVIEPGMGYSTDSNLLTEQSCYRIARTSVGGLEMGLSLDHTVTTAEVARALGVPIELSGGFNLFSTNVKAKYVREIMENEYSMSLNYYAFASRTVVAKFAGYGEDALTDWAKMVYQDGTNPEFGTTCGNLYLSSFEQGAILAMNLKVQFNSSVDKREFETSSALSFGNIFRAMVKISRSAKQRHYKPSLRVNAFQLGGDPSLLPTALKVNCSMDSTELCFEAGKSLLAYASNSFPSQLKGAGLVPLGFDHASFKPISTLGLKWNSQINDDILRAREQLVSKMRESNYYKEKLYPYLNSAYPVPLDKSFVREAKLLLRKVERNVNILMRNIDGAANCWNWLSNCLAAKRKIDRETNAITPQDLHFVEKTKYIYVEDGGITLYNDGQSWSNVNQEVEYVYEFVLNPKEFRYKYSPTTFINAENTNTIVSSENEITAAIYDCHSKDGGNTYKCKFNYQNIPFPFEAGVLWEDVVKNKPPPHRTTLIKRKICPFYFEMYKL